MQRRKFIALTGATTVPLIAGCTGSDDEDGNGGENGDDDDGENGDDGNGDGGNGENEDNGDEDDEMDEEEESSFADETEGVIDLMFGETAAVSFDIEYTVENLELVDEYEREGTDRVSEASEGSQYADVTVSVHNGHDGRVRIPRATEFTILDGKGSQFDRDVYGFADEYEGGEVQPDITREGHIMYEIPDDLSVEDLAVTLVRDGRDPEGRDYEMNIRWSEDGETE